MEMEKSSIENDTENIFFFLLLVIVPTSKFSRTTGDSRKKYLIGSRIIRNVLNLTVTTCLPTARDFEYLRLTATTILQDILEKSKRYSWMQEMYGCEKKSKG